MKYKIGWVQALDLKHGSGVGLEHVKEETGEREAREGEIDDNDR